MEQFNLIYLLLGVILGGGVLYTLFRKKSPAYDIGYVYVLGSQYLGRNVYKIGMTEMATPKVRAKDIYGGCTAAPVVYDVVRSYKVIRGNAYPLEKLVHKSLHKSRINKDREFFRLNIDKISDEIINQAKLNKIKILK